MKIISKSSKLSVAVALALAAVATPALAYTDIPWMATVQQLFIQKVQDMATQAINNTVNQMGNDVSSQVSRSGYGVQSEISKMAIAQKNTAEAIAQYQAQQTFNFQALEVSEKLQQPKTTCASMAVGNNLGKVAGIVKNSSSQRSRAATQIMLASKISPAARTVASYDSSLQKYCTQGDQDLGRCTVAKNPIPMLAGADVHADMLFGAATNGVTGPGAAASGASGTYIAGQADAMKDYIARITGSLPPEALAARDIRDEQTPQGKAYSDLARRYAALMSMASYSLNSILSSHEAQPGLGDQTMMTARVGKDASMMDVISAFVQEKFSAKAMSDQSNQVQAEVILRDMAQTNAFRLWMEYQNLQQTERIEAMNAMQLALMTEAQLKPQLAAQRAAVAAR